MSEKENDPEWKAVNDHVSSGVDSEGLDERRRQLSKRERELEQREQEILERREETVERKEALDEKEAELEDRVQQLRERASELEARETTLDERETEIDTKREALQEYFEQGGTDVFTYRPRVTAAFLLWTVAVVGAALAAATFLYASAPDPPLLSAPLLSEVGRLAATGVLGAAAVVELVGGFTTYYGRSWYFSVLAAVVGTVLLLPVGFAAIVMITVGESGFD